MTPTPTVRLEAAEPTFSVSVLPFRVASCGDVTTFLSAPGSVKVAIGMEKLVSESIAFDTQP